jgi:hypothetical protein
MAKTALYYPSIAFKNAPLIKALALFYGTVFRIVPDGLIPEDSSELQPLLEDPSIGVRIDPAPYAARASDQFLRQLGGWDAAALVPINEDDASYARIHAEKMDWKVRALFDQAGYRRDGDWMYVPASMASNFMLYLAKDIADANRLELVTSEWGAWTATSYFEMNGEIDLLPISDRQAQTAESAFGLFGLMLERLVPLNIAEIPAEMIARFRMERASEIEAFHDCLDALKVELSQLESADVSEERIRTKARELASAMDDFRKSADNLKATGWFGSQLVSVPGLALLESVFAIPQAATVALGATCLALGGLFSISKTKEKLQELRRKSHGSLLVDLQRDFRRYTSQRGGGDMNFHAWNCMEEYIND